MLSSRHLTQREQRSHLSKALSLRVVEGAQKWRLHLGCGITYVISAFTVVCQRQPVVSRHLPVRVCQDLPTGTRRRQPKPGALAHSPLRIAHAHLRRARAAPAAFSALTARFRSRPKIRFQLHAGLNGVACATRAGSPPQHDTNRRTHPSRRPLSDGANMGPNTRSSCSSQSSSLPLTHRDQSKHVGVGRNSA